MKKVQKLVKNAYDLHGSGDKSQSTSLLNYMRLAEEREVGGGFLWAWKLFLSGNVYDEEGKCNFSFLSFLFSFSEQAY